MDSEKLIQAFATGLNIEHIEAIPSLSYNTHPNWDSTAHMLLITEIEQAFDIMLDMDDIIAMNSYDKAVEIVKKHVG